MGVMYPGRRRGPPIALAALVCAVAPVACYRPEPASCQLTCTTATGCPGALTCGADGFCHADGEPATCGPDATVTPSATAVAAGAHHACAVLGGRLWCWGDNGGLQLGAGAANPAVVRRTAVPIEVEPALTTWTLVAAGRAHTCAVHDDGVWCWGDGSSGQTGTMASAATATRVADAAGPLSGVTAVCAGDRHGCAIVDGGAHLTCWGDDTFGQRGDADTAHAAETASPVDESSSSGTWTAVACGAYHTCAIRGGAAYCWGQNDHGQLGRTGGLRDRPAAPLAGLTQPVAVVAGADHACAIAGDRLWCWGAVRGGTAATPVDVTPARLSPRTVTRASAGGAGTCASNGAQTFCLGLDGAGERGDGSFGYSDDFPTNPVVGLSGVTALTSGTGFHCALAGGQVRCWGDNASGQIGAGEIATGFTARKVPGTWTAVAAGTDATCALDDAGKPWCWGHNVGLVPGNGNPIVDEPGQVSTTLVADRIVVGTEHACAREATSGRVWCWGDALYGRLASGGVVRQLLPPAKVQVAGVDLVDATALAVSDHASMAATASHLYGWGDNDSFRIAAPAQPAPAPGYGAVVAVDDNGWGQLALGDKFGCAVAGTAPGPASCWGDDTLGQGGDGSAGGTIPHPAPVSGGLSFSQLAAGGHGGHVCGLAAGAAYCWGDNRQRQVAGGVPSPVASPRQIGSATDWSAITAGSTNTVGVRAGALYCWGRDDLYVEQCGLDRRSGVAFVDQPTQLGAGLGTFSTVTLGERHGCALTTDHQLYCWGDSRFGAAGLAGAHFYPVSQAVLFP